LENGFPEQDKALEEKIQAAYDKQSDLTYEGHAGQIQDMLLAAAGEKDLLVDGRQGRQTLELITAIYQSSSLGESVTLPLDDTSPFYTRDGVMKHATYFYEKKNVVENFSENEITSGGNA